jgi:hypothetical protein
MKHLFLISLSLFTGLLLWAQEPASATKGVTYGAGTTAEGAITASTLDNKITDNKYTGKVTGKIVEVCQEKGCWMKMEKNNGETLMIKFKDYGFFMPKDIVGKQVVLEGEASIKETSVKQLQHYARDAGKSEAEVMKITQPKKEVIFVAKGVLVL